MDTGDSPQKQNSSDRQFVWQLWHWLTFPSVAIKDAAEQQKAFFLAKSLLTIIPLYLLPDIFRLITANEAIPRLLPGVLPLLVAYFFSRSRYYKVGVFITLLFFTCLPAVSILVGVIGPEETITTVIWIIPTLIFGSLLLNTREIKFLITINLLVILSLPLWKPNITYNALFYPLGFVLVVIILLAVAINARQEYLDEIESKARELARSETQFRSLVEHSHAGILQVNDTFQFVYVNDRFCQITGYSHVELIGRDFRMMLDGETRDLLANAYLRNQAGEYVPGRYEFSIICKDGQNRPVEISAGSFVGENGRLQTIAQLIDITERKRAETALQNAHDELEKRVQERTQELAEANAQLKKLDHLKNKFIEDMSHELRTPLANMNLYLDLLEIGKPEKQDHYLAVLRQATNRVTRISEDVLAMIRLELFKDDIRFKPVNLNTLAASVTQQQKQLAGTSGLDLIFVPNPVIPLVRADENRIRHCLINLIANSINYTAEGQIEVRTLLDETGRRACLAVADTGTGIDPADLPYLFDRFYRGHQVGQSNIPGSGLGLALVREVAELHGGSVEAENRPDKGSIFRLWLPLANS
ncbi:MAG: PAS domain-containing sensor histidine kinase [Ardenticatenaceae bacterium]|nr:PAS domain-containing sensor histidine kinase [Ardenticatenaceae bacterium]